MKPFLSTVVNRIDAKGRVSVPAGFRSAVKDSGLQGVICFPSFSEKSIEGCSAEQLGELSDMIDQMPPFSEKRDALAASILGNAHELTFDKEGRIKLPEKLMVHAGLSGEVMFMGLGRKFKIWNPATYSLDEERLAAMARESRDGLRFGGAS